MQDKYNNKNVICKYLTAYPLPSVMGIELNNKDVLQETNEC